MKQEKYYFLFGYDITRTYNDGGIECVIEDISKGCDYATYMFDRRYLDLSDPIDLLETYDGWDGWIEITEEDYIQLQKPILESDDIT